MTARALTVLAVLALAAGCKARREAPPPAATVSADAAMLAPAPDASPPPPAPAADAAPEPERAMAPEVPTLVPEEPGAGAPADASADAHAVREVLDAVRPRWTACLQEDDGGSLTLDVRVAADGKLLAASTDRGPSDHFAGCVLRAVRAARFPRLGQETHVRDQIEQMVMMR